MLYVRKLEIYGQVAKSMCKCVRERKTAQKIVFVRVLLPSCSRVFEESI